MTKTVSQGSLTALWAPVQALERTTLKDQVASLIREHIMKGKLPPGARMIERELAAWLDVSRMPVHEALLQLEKEGLVVKKPDARYVTQLTRQDLNELFPVRVVLERLAAEMAAKNHSLENAEQFTVLLGFMEDAVQRQDIEAFIDGHIALHRTIWQQARSPHLLKAMESILTPILMFMARSEYINWDSTLERHGSIIAAINAGDQAEAGECMTRHIHQSLQHIMQSFEQDH